MLIYKQEALIRVRPSHPGISICSSARAAGGEAGSHLPALLDCTEMSLPLLWVPGLLGIPADHPRTLEDSPDFPSFSALPFLFESFSFLMQLPSLYLYIPFSWNVPALHYRNTMYQYIICTSGFWWGCGGLKFQCLWILCGGAVMVWKRGGRKQSFGWWLKGKGGSLPLWLKLTLNQLI